MTTSSVTWTATANGSPPDEEDVLVTLPDGGVWVAYLDDGQWRLADAWPLDQAPKYWARFPAAPVPA